MKIIDALEEVIVSIKAWADKNKVDSSTIGNISDLQTKEKSNIVSAINEVAANGDVSIIVDPTLALEGQAADAKAVGDALNRKVSTVNNIEPDEYGNVFISSGESGSVIPDVTEEDNGAVLGVANGEWDKVNLPIAVSDDGYTSIGGLRNATSIHAVKSGNTIVIETTYDGGVVSQSVITLDENDYPIAITTNGTECAISLEGFE